MPLAALLLSLLLGQATTYVWTDQAGEDHYTDDRSSIPKGVKVRTTEGTPVEVVKRRPAPGTEQPAAAAREELEARDRCAAARDALAAAEKRLAEARTFEADPAPLAGCQAVLAARGQGAYAQCMAAGNREGKAEEARPERQKRKVEAAEAEVEQARDRLRRVTSAGCH